jgi:hypothetical protein
LIGSALRTPSTPRQHRSLPLNGIRPGVTAS